MRLERISALQVMTMLVVSRLSLTLAFHAPHPESQYDEWWHAPFYVGTGVLFFGVIHLLAQRFPTLTFARILEVVLGKGLGKLVLLLYVAFFVLLFSLTVRQAGEVFLFAFLPKTPISVVMGVMVLLAGWSAKSGVEVLGRTATVIFPMLIGIVVFIFVRLLKEVHFSVLWPPRILHTGPRPHLQDWFGAAARSVEFLWVAMLAPLVQDRSRLFRAITFSQVWLGAAWTLMAVVIYGILGADVTPYAFPLITVSEMIEIADFVERIEGVLLVGWVFGFVIRAAMLVWAGALGMAQGLGLRDYRPLVLPLAALGLSYSVAQAESLEELTHFLRPEVFTMFCLTFVLVIPAAVLVVDLVRALFGVESVSGKTQ